MNRVEKFDLVLDTSRQGFTIAEQMIGQLYRPFFDDPSAMQKSESWEAFKGGNYDSAKEHPPVLVFAKSTYAPRLNLGFIAGGIHPQYHHPHILALGVLHDERRRGIATSLITRFFTHSGYASATLICYRNCSYDPWEVAALVKKFNGDVVSMMEHSWWFQIPNPNLFKK